MFLRFVILRKREKDGEICFNILVSRTGLRKKRRKRMNWIFFYERTESRGSLGWDEPISMFSTVVIMLVLVCVSLLTGIAEWVLRNFGVISWIVMLAFFAIAILKALAYYPRSKRVLAIICMLGSQLTFGFFVLLTLRDLALVAKEGLAGLIGFVFLAPLYALGLTICYIPNQVGRDYSNETWAPVMDALVTPGLIALACKIFWLLRFCPASMACADWGLRARTGVG